MTHQKLLQNCDLLALEQLISSLAGIRLNNLRENPEQWVERVDKCKFIALNILNSNEASENNDHVKKCRLADIVTYNGRLADNMHSLIIFSIIFLERMCIIQLC